MNDVSFASPWLLFLLLAVPLLAALPYWWRRRLGPAGMRYAYNRLVSGNSRSLRLRLMPFVSALRFLALALVIVAAARPQVSDAREVIRGEGVDIAIALDISGSMGQTDFAPNRLGAAKQIVAEFIEERKYDRIGLVVFSREAFIQSPLLWTTTSCYSYSATCIWRTNWGSKTEQPWAAAWQRPPTC